jgi:hypothetical protein
LRRHEHARFYTLDAIGHPVPCNRAEWERCLADREKCIVRQNDLENGVSVSTVFIGINKRVASGAPLLWETIISGGPHNNYETHYSSRGDALKGHASALALAINAS